MSRATTLARRGPADDEERVGALGGAAAAGSRCEACAPSETPALSAATLGSDPNGVVVGPLMLICGTRGGGGAMAPCPTSIAAQLPVG